MMVTRWLQSWNDSVPMDCYHCHFLIDCFYQKPNANSTSDIAENVHGKLLRSTIRSGYPMEPKKYEMSQQNLLPSLLLVYNPDSDVISFFPPFLDGNLRGCRQCHPLQETRPHERILNHHSPLGLIGALFLGGIGVGSAQIAMILDHL